MDTISIASLSAHNAGREMPSCNESYNQTHSLGNVSERILLKNAAAWKSKDNNERRKLTRREAEFYLKVNPSCAQ